MASISITNVNQKVIAVRTNGTSSDCHAVTIKIGKDALYLSREEAAQLGAELLNAAGAVPVGVAA